MRETFEFTKLIVPYLFIGVFISGWLLGRPGKGTGLIPASYIETLVGGNGLVSCIFASLAGALMYFATLTEIPILQGLIGAGMGKGPALSLLLAARRSVFRRYSLFAVSWAFHARWFTPHSLLCSPH